MESGALLIRGAEEAYPLEEGTITGTNTDGVLSDIQFATPTISFEQEVTSPVETSVAIDAIFTQLGAGTGSIDPDGNVTARISLRVDLELVVAIAPGAVFRCTASPVTLNLASTAPHDGGRVTLRAGNFTVPPVGFDDLDCPELIGGAVNDQLAGGGHSLTMQLAGELTPPPEPGEPTVTTLAVDPADGAAIGDPVTLTTQVAVEDDESEGTPQGLVEFRDGNQSLGLSELNETGVATLETTALPAGNRRLTARYLGAPPDYALSVSAELTYVVTAGATLTADIPATVRTGGAAVDLGLTVLNPGFGAPLSDVRVDVAIWRDRPRPQAPQGSGAIGPDGPDPRIELVQVVGEDEEAVPLTHSGSGTQQRLDGTIGDPVGWDLAPGATRVEALRLRAADGVSPGPLLITFTLVQVDPDTEEPEATLTTGTGRITMVEDQRRASQITGGSVVPVAARQGTFVTINNPAVGPAVDLVGPYGEVEFTIDGRPVLAQSPAGGGWLPHVPARGAGGSLGRIQIQVPSDMPAGQRTITATFLGDPVFEPSQASWPLRVEPALGTIYDCAGGLLETTSSRLLIDVAAGLPSVATPGAVVPLSDLQVALRAPRGYVTDSFIGSMQLPPPTFMTEVSFAFGPGGSGTASQITRQYSGRMTSEDGQGIDDLVRFTDEQGQVALDGEMGQGVDVTLDEVVIRLSAGQLTGVVRCIPAADAAVVGRVTVAGTTLAADVDGPVREGEPVTFDAERLPTTAGSIEFLADGEPIAHVGAPEGRATAVVDDLPAGTHQVTARFLGGLTDPVTTSEPVEVVVEPGPVCSEFLHSGNGATVRLVYLELLRRCPDQAGYDYWVEQLDSFASTPEQFARSIAGTPEAVGVVVNDGYQTMLGRNAEPTGKAFWVERMRSGTGRYDQLLADLGASGEFWSKAGATNTGFVTRVYDRLLHRSPDQSGLDYWVGRLDDGTSRRALILSLANLDEPLGVLVTRSYEAMLDRAPDTTERSDGITHLRSTGDRSGLYAQLIGQAEFATRAQGFPNP